MKRRSIPDLTAAKTRGQRLVMITAYDAPMARLADEAGADALLVGDSLAMTVLGMSDTLDVTMDQMLHHCRAVGRGSEQAAVVLDLPFMSYQAGDDEAMRNAGRALKEGHAQSVKLEGGEQWAPLVARMVDAGIPVMAHIGLTPQWVRRLGGYPTSGTTPAAAAVLLADAAALTEAGAWSIVLEKVPREVAAAITARVRVPTIGIAAGPHCDGQVQVMHDLLGLDERFRPRHSGHYLSLAAEIREAIGRYAGDVRAGAFPADEHSEPASAELAAFLKTRQ